MSDRRNSINLGKLGYNSVKSGKKKHAMCMKCNTVLKVITTKRLETHRNMCDTGQRKKEKEWPTKVAYESLGFTLMRVGRKYMALCTICNKVMKNTAANRLEVHRNKCQGIKRKKRQLKNVKSNIERLGYVSMKLNQKYNALCTICNKIMKNTATSRLETHRKKCKYIEKIKEDLPTRTMHMADFDATDQKKKTKIPRRNNATKGDVVMMDKIKENSPIEKHSESVVVNQLEFSNTPQCEARSINFQPPLVQNYPPLRNDLFTQAYDDDNLSFGLYVASKLKAFNDPYIQAIAKHDINRVISNIELKQCELINKESLFKHLN